MRLLVAAAASVAVSAWLAWDGHDVRGRSRHIRDAPTDEAHARAPDLAASVRGDLDHALAGAGDLALGRFSISPGGELTTSIAAGAEPRASSVADDSFRGEVARSLVAPLRADATLTAALAWRTEPFAGGPALVAARRGSDAQSGDAPDARPGDATITGLVVDRATLTSRLAQRAGTLVAELHTGDAGGLPIAPGWQLTVGPNPLAVRQARIDATDLVRGFEIRAGVVAVVLLLGWSVVLARRPRG